MEARSTTLFQDNPSRHAWRLRLLGTHENIPRHSAQHNETAAVTQLVELVLDDNFRRNRKQPHQKQTHPIFFFIDRHHIKPRHNLTSILKVDVKQTRLAWADIYQNWRHHRSSSTRSKCNTIFFHPPPIYLRLMHNTLQ